MGGSPHHYLAVDNQLRPVLAWFGALILPRCGFLTGTDFRDGPLASQAARRAVQALLGTMLLLARKLQPAALGPAPGSLDHLAYPNRHMAALGLKSLSGGNGEGRHWRRLRPNSDPRMSGSKAPQVASSHVWKTEARCATVRLK